MFPARFYILPGFNSTLNNNKKRVKNTNNMKKKILWLLLVVPTIFIAASSPLSNINADWQSSDCSSSGNSYDSYNGEQGCPYEYDFSSFVNCTLYNLDLDRNTPAIDHYLNKTTAEVWYTSEGKIEMIPKDGYGGDGFVLTLDIRAYFNNGNSYEDEYWTCNVTAGTPPYPDPCY